MAMQNIPKQKEKFESVRIFDPKQKLIAVTHEFRGHPFVFFNNKRGLLLGKGVRPSFDNRGNQVTDFGWGDVVEHFKGMGFKVEHLDNKGQPIKKTEPKTTTVEPKTTISTKVEDKKEDKK